jgi:hypothetical protein
VAAAGGVVVADIAGIAGAAVVDGLVIAVVAVDTAVEAEGEHIAAVRKRILGSAVCVAPVAVAEGAVPVAHMEVRPVDLWE